MVGPSNEPNATNGSWRISFFWRSGGYTFFLKKVDQENCFDNVERTAELIDDFETLVGIGFFAYDQSCQALLGKLDVSSVRSLQVVMDGTSQYSNGYRNFEYLHRFHSLQFLEILDCEPFRIHKLTVESKEFLKNNKTLKFLSVSELANEDVLAIRDHPSLIQVTANLSFLSRENKSCLFSKYSLLERPGLRKKTE